MGATSCCQSPTQLGEAAETTTSPTNRDFEGRIQRLDQAEGTGPMAQRLRATIGRETLGLDGESRTGSSNLLDYQRVIGGGCTAGMHVWLYGRHARRKHDEVSLASPWTVSASRPKETCWRANKRKDCFVISCWAGCMAEVHLGIGPAMWCHLAKLERRIAPSVVQWICAGSNPVLHDRRKLAEFCFGPHTRIVH